MWCWEVNNEMLIKIEKNKDWKKNYVINFLK